MSTSTDSTGSTRRRISPTLALCLAGGLAAGIALARPASDDGAPAPAPAAAPAAGDPTATSAPAPADDGFAYEIDAEQSADASNANGAEAPAAPVVPATGAIEIRDFAFGSALTVAPGTEITVTNVDGAPHTVTADDGSFGTPNLGQNESAVVIAPATPGTYSFFCAIHPSMTGQLVVS
ncbi:MAG: cupredoxin domain-containing protein [Actinomycetota bacterium]